MKHKNRNARLQRERASLVVEWRKQLGTPLQPVSQAAYARHRGVSRQRIFKLVKAGRVPVVHSKGRKLIGIVEADWVLAVPQIEPEEELFNLLKPQIADHLMESCRLAPGRCQRAVMRTLKEFFEAHLVDLASAAAEGGSAGLRAELNAQISQVGLKLLPEIHQALVLPLPAGVWEDARTAAAGRPAIPAKPNPKASARLATLH